MKINPIIVFVVTYALFLVSGAIFQLDKAWYEALAKPSFTPPGYVIGIVWFVLFFLIALAVALLDAKVGLGGFGPALVSVLVVNYLSNQLFTFFSFSMRNWFVAGIDSGVVALTAIAFITLAWRISRPAALLFVPYAAWSTFATYLSFTIWSMNR